MYEMDSFKSESEVVYTIQPVVKPVEQPVEQSAVCERLNVGLH